MNVRACLSVLGLLTLFAAGCGGGADELALSALPRSPTLAAGERVEVTLTLTRRGASKTATLSASGLPAGLSASFEPAELTAQVHTSVLLVEASDAMPPGAYVVEVQVAEGGHTGSLEIPVQVVTASVSGTISFQSGRPMTSAIVEVPGHGAVLVDEEGAFEIPQVSPPYDLRVSWPETGSVHIYRGLEARRVTLRPFADSDRPDPKRADFEVTLTNWVPGSELLAWAHAEDQPAYIEWYTLPDATGLFWGGAVHHKDGPAILQGLSVERSAAWVVNAYRGYVEAPMTLDADGSAKGLNAELTPIGSFEAHPEVTAAPGLTLKQVCPVVEQPYVSRRLFCHAPEQGPPLLPELPSGELALVMEYANPDGGISRRVLRGITPENSAPAVTFLAPPVLESPASDALIDWTQRFLVAVEGEAPITFSLQSPDSLRQIHVTTREREIAFPELGPFVPRPESPNWQWVVRALPEASGWEVLEDGGVVGIQDRFDADFRRAALGQQPHITRSEVRPVRINWW